MNEPLHPLTLSEILDRTAQIYRSRFLIFLGIAAIPAGTIFVLAAGTFAFIAWVGVNTRHGANIADILVWIFLSALMILVIPAGLAASALGEAAMSDATALYFLGGIITIRNSYKAAWKCGWRYIGLYLLQGLAIVAVPAAVFLIAIFGMVAGKVSGIASNDPSPLFGGIAVLLFLVLGSFSVWMLLRICLAFPACVVEQTAAWNALKRGTMLSHGTRSRILLLYILGLVLNQILAWAVTIPAIIVLALIPGPRAQAHAEAMGMIAMFLIYGAMFVVRALTKPVYGIALTLFYFDQRIRKEGFDIEWMMREAGMLQAETPGTVPERPIMPVHETPEVPSAFAAAADDPALEAMEPFAAHAGTGSASPEESNA
jgi:hypothetical protein